MRRSLELDIEAIELYYTITEDGRVWSKVKNRWLKAHDNVYGYVFYSISKGVPKCVTVFAHTLVALKYCKEGYRRGLEVDHKDNDKANNHWTNLQWVTHSENILKSYERGRDSYWLNRKRGRVGDETRVKMANAKKKRVEYSFSGGTAVYESIDDAARELGTYRKRVYLGIKEGKEFKGGYFSVLNDVYDESGA